MKTISLNGKWELKGREQDTNNPPISLSATVPGCVQLDLSAAGYLPEDLYYGENILEAEKYEPWEWWYEKTFDAPSRLTDVYLVFEGVDCFAEYYLNGHKLGESENMFIAHEFRVDEFLEPGENRLTVHLLSAKKAVEKVDFDVKAIMRGWGFEARPVRKAPHSYGWDIMPRAVTAGLWREVRLELRDEVYFEQKFIRTRDNYAIFHYVLSGKTEALCGLTIDFSGSCGDSSFHITSPCWERAGFFSLAVEDVKKWFPYGYGEPNIYDCTLKILRKDEVIHQCSLSFGFRDVVLDRQVPAEGQKGQFRFLINGEEIMCKGSNWVPLDAFHSRDAQRYEQALALVKDIGCNILRCWGGNVYEDHAFFDFCDRNGIMVWQDFAMACGFYPETEEFKKNLAKEATAVIRKLRNHPSIVLWAGDNEVDFMAQFHNPDDNSLTREVLPKCIDLNDTCRPYLPSSPYITGDEFRRGVRSQVLGSTLVEDHLWGPRDYFKDPFYSANKAHFISEIGYLACPSWESICKFIAPEYRWPYQKNPQWILHSSDQKGVDLRLMTFEKHIRDMFGVVPTDRDDFVLASQIAQAEAKKYFIERMRLGRPEKTGIIWWNLLDGWPQFSDSVVDYYFTKKLAYHYIKRSQAPFILAAGEPVEGILPIYASNDTLTEQMGHFTVEAAETGTVLLEGDFTATKNAPSLIARLPLSDLDQKCFILRWKTETTEGMNHYLLGNPPIDLEKYRKILNKLGV